MSAVASGRIGPNILIQTAHTLQERLGAAQAERILRDSTDHGLRSLPGDMVDERLPNALFRALDREFGLAFTRSVMRDAGRRTGDYLLAHRIPRPAQWLLGALPPSTGMRLLLTAIGRHTWTFAGSAHVHITPGDPALISVERCPICLHREASEPVCDFYTGTFARLAQALLGPEGWAEEVSCSARGDSACRFLMGSRRSGPG